MSSKADSTISSGILVKFLYGITKKNPLPFIFILSIGNWANVNNRRVFFDNLARTHQFNPLEPEKWYSLPSSVLKSLKVVFFF